MGTTNTTLYTKEHNEQAELFKALGHPARLKIITHLLAVKSCICGDIVSAIQLSQPSITRHLKVLKDARVIQGTIEGNSVCYCLDPQTISKLNELVSLMAIDIESTNEQCC
ncbi:MAG: metalloregulator ArsR/SmtB family transcription factor [Crocinitomicaceae bacterium]|nr:metalloregulator ArsR/SmtB family transcription factor [Crocinitomicaceae bacterium]